MKTGLILEGGAMRGMFTMGILDQMMQAGIEPDGTIGVSAGAAFGCNLKSHQQGRALRYNMRFAKDWRFCSVRSWLLTGDLYGGHFCYDILPKELDVWDTETFAKDPMAFWVVATNAYTGNAEYHLCSDGGEDDLRWIQASASMPVASKPVEVDGFALLDGGISDSVPLKKFRELGYDRNVVILTQPADYRKQPFTRKQELFLKAGLHKYPKIYEKLKDRWKVYNEQIAMIRQEEEAGRILVLRPDSDLHISAMCHDAMEKKRVYLEGVKTGKANMEKIRSFWAGN